MCERIVSNIKMHDGAFYACAVYLYYLLPNIFSFYPFPLDSFFTKHAGHAVSPEYHNKFQFFAYE